MSQETVELIQRGFEAYGRGDVEAILEFVAPQVVVYAQLGLAQAGTDEGWPRRWCRGQPYASATDSAGYPGCSRPYNLRLQLCRQDSARLP
jgi:ketosteroid isomerase-like protein